MWLLPLPPLWNFNLCNHMVLTVQGYCAMRWSVWCPFAHFLWAPLAPVAHQVVLTSLKFKLKSQQAMFVWLLLEHHWCGITSSKRQNKTKDWRLWSVCGHYGSQRDASTRWGQRECVLWDFPPAIQAFAHLFYAKGIRLIPRHSIAHIIHDCTKTWWLLICHCLFFLKHKLTI